MTRLNVPELAGTTQGGSSSLPSCTRCASPTTEPVAAMMRHTANASQWYHCEGCGHVFTTSDDDDVDVWTS